LFFLLAWQTIGWSPWLYSGFLCSKYAYSKRTPLVEEETPFPNI
jgi:hypothetical protein